MTRQFVNQSEFARMQGVDKAHISRLKEAGRLVMVEQDGKQLVDVAASRALIEKTSSPSHAGNGSNSGAAAKMSPSAAFNEAKARKETALAEQAEMEAAKMRGSLVNAEEVRLFAADLGASFRAALEVLPDRLAPELVAMQDVEAVRGALVESFEQLLHDIASKIEQGMQA